MTRDRIEVEERYGNLVVEGKGREAEHRATLDAPSSPWRYARAQDRKRKYVSRRCEKRNFRRRVKYALFTERESSGNDALTLDESVECTLVVLSQ